MPYVFTTAAMLTGLPARRPAATHGQVGLYCYDTMTLVGPGSWAAISAAADAALTAERLRPVQSVGVVAALGGVLLLSS